MRLWPSQARAISDMVTPYADMWRHTMAYDSYMRVDGEWVPRRFPVPEWRPDRVKLTKNQLILGDPPPGRSALDKRREK